MLTLCAVGVVGDQWPAGLHGLLRHLRVHAERSISLGERQRERKRERANTELRNCRGYVRCAAPKPRGFTSSLRSWCGLQIMRWAFQESAALCTKEAHEVFTWAVASRPLVGAAAPGICQSVSERHIRYPLRLTCMVVLCQQRLFQSRAADKK